MKIDVLDHGYVEFIEAWGTGKGGKLGDPDDNIMQHLNWDHEVGVIEAARQSTQGSFRGWDMDQKLLAFLHNNRHATPFEFAGMVLEVQAPIFVFREWHRHRTQSYNEMSARYSPLPDLYYIQTLERVMQNGGTNKQASGVAESEQLTEETAKEWLSALGDYEGMYHHCELWYKNALQRGISKELARVIMPVGHYSRMRASANLRNWLSFLTLRMAPNAQWEIREYANAVGKCIEQAFPQTWKLFTEATK